MVSKSIMPLQISVLFKDAFKFIVGSFCERSVCFLSSDVIGRVCVLFVVMKIKSFEQNLEMMSPVLYTRVHYIICISSIYNNVLYILHFCKCIFCLIMGSLPLDALM